MEIALREGDWLSKLIRRLVDDNFEAARERVRKARERWKGITDDDLANSFVDDASFWAAVVGAGVGVVNSIPGIGQAVAISSVAPEVVYLTKLQIDTAIQIAVVYDYDIDQQQLALLTLGCLAYSWAFDAIKETVKQSATAVTRRAIEHVVAKCSAEVATKTAAKIGAKFCEEGLIKRVPLVAVPIGAVMNYGGLQVFGWAAIKFFSPHYARCRKCAAIISNRSKFCSECGGSVQAW